MFGQTMSPRLINRFDLLTGALPAQYGLRTAGVIDVTTKTGLFDNGGTISLYGGSHATLQPSIEYGGSSGATNYFVSASYTHNDLGIENVNSAAHAIHDRTDQGQFFGYVEHIFSDSDKVSLLGGYSNQWFQIPNPDGLTSSGAYSYNGRSAYLSNDLNETQLERTGFGQLAWLHDAGAITVQTAFFARYSSLAYRPDITGELLFNGQAQQAYKSDVAVGLQSDLVWRASGHHTLRFGGYVQHDHSRSDTTTFVFPVDDAGNQSGSAYGITDNAAQNAWMVSLYGQDEWKLTPRLTLNYGLRFDAYSAYRSEHQFSPRVNVVWQPLHGTTLHAGYAHYFSPPPFELVANTTIARFAGTSAAAASTDDTTPFAERQQYFDAGIQQQVARGLMLGMDGYYRISTNLIDEGQFGAPIILTPFNYQKGRIRGVNFYANYNRGPWSAYANFAMSKAEGENIVSSQFSFGSDDLAYIRNHYIYLDHDQTYTGSAGVTYSFRHGDLKGLKLGGSMIYGSGLRRDLVLADGSSVPNGDKLPAYEQFNLSTSYRLEKAGVELRFDIINLFDARYEIRDGTGVGVGAPEWGPRRGFFFGISKDI
ncbi:MAG TPA: TonB-dependent receptor, partial [Novosphingobium sp.]|nr:TonB-dependent receptor [Novosphingobium sp.]